MSRDPSTPWKVHKRRKSSKQGVNLQAARDIVGHRHLVPSGEIPIPQSVRGMEQAPFAARASQPDMASLVSEPQLSSSRGSLMYSHSSLLFDNYSSMSLEGYAGEHAGSLSALNITQGYLPYNQVKQPLVPEGYQFSSSALFSQLRMPTQEALFGVDPQYSNYIPHSIMPLTQPIPFEDDQPSNEQQLEAYPESFKNTHYHTEFSQPEIPKNEVLFPQQRHYSTSHTKNLSISSHFNLFNLNEGEQFSNSNESDSVSDIRQQFSSVDGSNVHNFLLSILHKVPSPIPLDDFYVFLYNNDKQITTIKVDHSLKIDKTSNIPASQESAFGLLNQILNIFKNPSLLNNQIPDIHSAESRLANINYHELLRTLLALKILLDILVELPKSENSLNHTIPRLSIYKTYYIICQKLITQYPSSTNTQSEQQKLILGQSKLGKLLKVVYPNLIIKRLGSRGDSKYNYLGVSWNEKIVSDDVKSLCDNYDLSNLSNIFTNLTKNTSRKSRKNSSYDAKSISRAGSDAQSKISSQEYKRNSSPDSIYMTPNFSFLNPYCKFTSDDEFNMVNMYGDHENWFFEKKQKVLRDLEGQLSMSLKPSLDSMLLNENLVTDDSLCTNTIENLFLPLHDNCSHIKNLDLRLYAIMVLELLPYLLLLGSPTESEFLKNLKINLNYFINNFNMKLRDKGLDSFFSSVNLNKFLTIVKKLLSVNGMLLFLLNRPDKDIETMVNDIEGLSPDLKVQIDSEESYLLDSTNTNNIFLANLLHTLRAFCLIPTKSESTDSSWSFDALKLDSIFLQNFFTHDLVNFFHSFKNSSSHHDLNVPEHTSWKNDNSRILLIYQLVHHNLLTPSIRHKYPALVCANSFSLILNEIMKLLFYGFQSKTTEEFSINQVKFKNWWTFNSFLQEYLTLISEVVSLIDLVRHT